MSDYYLLLETGGTDNLLLETGDNLLLEDSGVAAAALWRGGGNVPLALLLFDQPDGVLLYDWTLDAQGVRMSAGEHGDESLSWSVEMDIERAFRVYDGLKVPYVVLTAGEHAWEGRLEDKQVTAKGLELVAFGYWRAVSDYGPYNALWSDASTARWELLTADDIATLKPERFEADNNNRLYMAARNSEGFVNTDHCVWGYRIPHQSLRNIVACQFRYALGSGANWRARLLTRDSSWGSGSAQWTLAGGVSAKTGVENLTFSGAAALTFELEATGTLTMAADTGSTSYLKITQLRVATTTTNRVNTTIGSSITAGTRTVTPASMSNIFVGQKLWVDGSSDTGEVVTVTAITSTTFDAVFAIDHATAITVKGIVVYASEIAEDIVAKVAALNSTQLSTSTARIDDTSRDLEVELYGEKAAQDILGYLATEGDDDLFEVGVEETQRLYFRARGSRARVWYTDAVELDLGSTLDTLVNQTYSVYRAAGGGIRRTADADSDQSQALYGLVRRNFNAVSTTSQTQAEAQRDAYLGERGVITPRMAVVTSGLYDAADVEYPLWALRPGDELVLRNLPPTLTTSVDKIRRFRVKRKEYDVSRNILKPVPELELAGLDIVMTGPMVKQARDGVKVDGSRSNPAVDWVR